MGDLVAPGEHAHHIVPSTHDRAKPAQDLVEKYQIDINDAINGVGLKPMGSKPAHYGCGLHSHEGIDRVTERLTDAVQGTVDWAKARKALIDALRQLNGEIRRGLFP
jgi:hypothetical protein